MSDAVAALEARVAELERTVGIRRDAETLGGVDAAPVAVAAVATGEGAGDDAPASVPGDVDAAGAVEG
jgi:hypothetical protein